MDALVEGSQVDQYVSLYQYQRIQNQVIGTPVEADWPEESSVLRSNFSYARGRGVQGILAELDPQVGCHVITLDLTNARSHEMRAMCKNPR